MSIYNILKAKYLVQRQSLKHWFLIVYVIFWSLMVVANSHWYEEKTIEISKRTEQVKELRSEFVDRRSELMRLQMESGISQKMEALEIYPSEVPARKIKVVTNQEKKPWYRRIWE